MRKPQPVLSGSRLKNTRSRFTEPASLSYESKFRFQTDFDSKAEISATRAGPVIRAHVIGCLEDFFVSSIDPSL